MRQVGMLDLRTEYGLYADEIRAAVGAVLESQNFIGGPVLFKSQAMCPSVKPRG